jgi:KipI family sensor histidine kinase inhibitor
MGDSALLGEFGGPATEQTNRRVVCLHREILNSRIEGLVNLHPAYTSLLVVYDPCRWDAPELAIILNRLSGLSDEALLEPRTMEIPICVTDEFAPDLAGVAVHSRNSADEVIRRFAEAHFQVAFLGFAPGFPYLLGLPTGLATPRHARPRTCVPAGSIGIAGKQAGIYPAETPGGWQIIGRTPLRLFDPGREPMSLLAPGDAVTFATIDRQRFERLSR